MEFLKIGLILKPQGVRGELKVMPLTDDPSRFIGLTSAYLSPDEAQPVKIMGARLAGEYVYLFLERVYDRDAAEKMRDKFIYIDREHAIKLPEGRYFIVDLIGCTVRNEQGELIGEVVDVLQPGANDVYVVKGEQGEILIPMVDAFVKSTDIENRLITVDAKMLEETDED